MGTKLCGVEKYDIDMNFSQAMPAHFFQYAIKFLLTDIGHYGDISQG